MGVWLTRDAQTCQRAVPGLCSVQQGFFPSLRRVRFVETYTISILLRHRRRHYCCLRDSPDQTTPLGRAIWPDSNTDRALYKTSLAATVRGRETHLPLSSSLNPPAATTPRPNTFSRKVVIFAFSRTPRERHFPGSRKASSQLRSSIHEPLRPTIPRRLESRLPCSPHHHYRGTDPHI